MLKKAVMGSLAAALAAGFIFGSDVFSYMRTLGTNVREAVHAEIEPGFKLDVVRDDVNNLMPEIRQHMTVVAEQSVDVKDMTRAIADKEEALSRQKGAILALRSDLDSGQDKFTYRHVSYTRGQVEADLADRFDAFRTAEAALERDRQILAAQQDILRQNQKTLDGMLERKQKLVVKLNQLEARMKQVQAMEAVNCIKVDDSRISRAEKMIEEMHHSLDVRQTLLETEGHVLGRIPVEEAADEHDDVVTEIDRHFRLSVEQDVADADSSESI